MDNEGEDDHYEDSGEDMDNEGEDDHYEDSGEDKKKLYVHCGHGQYIN